MPTPGFLAASPLAVGLHPQGQAAMLAQKVAQLSFKPVPLWEEPTVMLVASMVRRHRAIGPKVPDATAATRFLQLPQTGNQLCQHVTPHILANWAADLGCNNSF